MSHFKKRIELLKAPAFRYFILSCLLSMFGAGMGYIAMTWAVLRGHQAVSAVAILMICFWLPGVILGPFMGVIVDRYSRKWIVIVANGIRALFYIAVGIFLYFSYSTQMIYYLALISGGIFAIYGPAIMRFIREIVSKDDLLYANSTIDIAYEVGNILGMGTVGVFIALFGVQIALIANGIFFLLAIILLMFIPKNALLTYEPKKPASLNIMNDFKIGLRYLLDRKVLMVIYTVQLLVMVEFMTAPVLLAPFSKILLHATVTQFGHIEAALSIGIVVGGIFLPWAAEKFGLVETIMVMTMSLGVCFVLFSYNRSISVAELLYFIIGFSAAVWPLIITKAQNLTDVEFQGRVQSTFNSLAGVLILTIYLSVKVSSHYISIPHLFWIEAVIAAIALILVWCYRKALA